MEITWSDIKTRIPFLNIIDIRESYLYKTKHIIGSDNIPYQYLLINPSDYLEKDEVYYIVCEYGLKSGMVSNILNKNGYHTHSISGGIKEYPVDDLSD